MKSTFPSRRATSLAVLISSIVSPRAHAQIYLDPPQYVHVAGNWGSLYNMLLEDFDEDGHLDLLMSLTEGSDRFNLTFWAGDGNGGFVFGNWVGGYQFLYAMVAGDFDEDGHQDVAYVNSSYGGLVILLGDGAGDFSLGSFHPAPDRAEDLLAGDFNHDQHLDLVVTSFVCDDGSPSLHVFLGDGLGGFVEGPAPEATSTHRIVAGDFDDDGHLDLAATTYTYQEYSLLILHGDGTGRFFVETVTDALGEVSCGITAGDLDEDGYLDLAVRGQEEFRIFRGDGAGGFSLLEQISDPLNGSNPVLQLEDLDQDGHLDILTSDRFGGRSDLQVRPGDGTGSFGRFLTVSGVGAHALVADIDEDGQQDVLGATNGSFYLITMNRTREMQVRLAGNVNAALGSPADVLLVNESPGIGPGRRLEIPAQGPLAVRMLRPPSATDPAPFALYAWLGEPMSETARVLPFGLGETAMPTPLTDGPGGPGGPLRVWNTLRHYPLLGEPTHPSQPADSVVLEAPILGLQATFFLQGLIQDAASPQGQVAVTNGVIVVSG